MRVIWVHGSVTRGSYAVDHPASVGYYTGLDKFCASILACRVQGSDGLRF